VMAAMTLPMVPPASGVRQIRPSHTPRIIGGAQHPRAQALTDGNSRSAARSARTCRIPHGCTALPTPPVAHPVKISELAARPASGAPGPMTGPLRMDPHRAGPEAHVPCLLRGRCLLAKGGGRVQGERHIRDLSTSNSAPGEDGSKPCSISQRAAPRLRHDHHARITSRSTSVP
jgi:hypothetical protein